MNDWTIRPRLDGSSSRGTPKNEDIMLGRTGIRKRISDDNFGSVRINSTNTSKDNAGGRIDEGCEDKVCGQQNQDSVNRPGDDRGERSGRKGEQYFPENIFFDTGLWRWSEQGEFTGREQGLPRVGE
jgi:hypothetical protein